MIGFTGEEILYSVLYALVYGAGFALIYRFVSLLFRMLKSIPSICSDALFSKDNFKFNNTFDYVKKQNVGAIYRFLSVIAFALGFILLSYLALDGEIRLYMLILSTASVYLVNLAFSVVFNRLFVFLINALVFAFVFVIRVIFLPLRAFKDVK